MTKELVNYPGLSPSDKPMGPAPLSPALKVGPFVFVSGQVALHPSNGHLVGTDITTQMRQTLENFRSLIEAAGLTMADVVKTNVFLTDVAHFGAMNEVYREFFPEPFPVRSTVGIRLGNPDLLVEIEGMAYRPEAA
jgi:2-iminobutanoate/2-iminopropanoate deaminase